MPDQTFEYEYNILIGEITSITNDYIAATEYDLKIAGDIPIVNYPNVIDYILRADLMVKISADDLKDKAVDLLDDLYQLKFKIPDMEKRDSYIDTLNLFMGTFYPDQNSLEEVEFSINYAVSEYADEINNNITKDANDFYDNATKIVHEVQSEVKTGFDDINNIVSDNMDIIERAISVESDAFFNWFTDSAQTMGDPILSEASIMHDQIVKIAEDVVNNAMNQAKGIEDKYDKIKQGISESVDTSLKAMRSYVDKAVDSVSEFVEGSIDELKSIMSEAADTAEEVVKPLFSVRTALIDYFMRVVVEAFEYMTASIPDIKL
ncbi:MAG: hypothetical protein KJ847_07065 [Firmicutes bacterium]|nr:hypothetical protein [Bacillota bacterium]